MAKMMGPRFKKCRSLGLNVVGHPKAMSRAEKGASVSRDSRKLSEYGLQLLEKQRLRAYYGVLEKQFVRYVNKAFRKSTNPGPILLVSLETRLDNMAYRMGFASSLRQARQMVNHGHFLVNGNKVDRPSYAIQAGDTISLKEKSQSIKMIAENLATLLTPLPYLEVQPEQFKGTLTRQPLREELPIEINEQLIVEFYSR
ncbi:30S ribosomal protein S4 [Candidatus Epulonipiscium fishelsonii]|uniref:30S ribosomal protein S4 n=1 Tax=Candidatus Epulonipiscium fishelsonii TaxID=77094 RepID=A0ACC8XBY5_9FIRM|nr:30S ribosomal protein S4 [Epulopiscium sp. SCG-B05WGA-EpuloA1]ONI40031.1 30S ribosomal protein S4 [Epulopiscium sp. SCG-B11WGA-EpuloA1]